jgi:excisionase family DNA binding protein
MNHTNESLLTVKDVAALLNVPVATIYSWRHEGKSLPPAVKMGRSLRFRRADVQAWIDEQFAGELAA